MAGNHSIIIEVLPTHVEKCGKSGNYFVDHAPKLALSHRLLKLQSPSLC